ncbi:uncharacterized protein LOC119168105 [Rhipicephalus microplus]|uniref:uncharacterized protein LOC119168105 n=1 Tax=Rhipicephalus microplus TaxID=6941 RepID=UPI003F6BCAF9
MKAPHLHSQALFPDKVNQVYRIGKAYSVAPGVSAHHVCVGQMAHVVEVILVHQPLRAKKRMDVKCHRFVTEDSFKTRQT